ncbi:unnamed protein product, partial [Adineta ricciae]
EPAESGDRQKPLESGDNRESAGSGDHRKPAGSGDHRKPAESGDNRALAGFARPTASTSIFACFQPRYIRRYKNRSQTNQAYSTTYQIHSNNGLSSENVKAQAILYVLLLPAKHKVNHKHDAVSFLCP